MLVTPHSLDLWAPNYLLVSVMIMHVRHVLFRTLELLAFRFENLTALYVTLYLSLNNGLQRPLHSVPLRCILNGILSQFGPAKLGSPYTSVPVLVIILLTMMMTMMMMMIRIQQAGSAHVVMIINHDKVFGLT